MRHFLYFIESLALTVLLVAIGLIPYVFCAYMGWLGSEELDLFVRIVGFFIVLFIIIAYTKWDTDG